MPNQWPSASMFLLIALVLPNPAQAAVGRQLVGEGQSGSQEKVGRQELSASQLFRQVAPAIFVVEALDGKGLVLKSGSGIAVAPDQIVTNNHVVEGAISIRVKQKERNWWAEVTHVDADHDLCRLTVKGLKTQVLRVRASSTKPSLSEEFESFRLKAQFLAVRVSSTLSVGERVYAIGAPEGMELTLSEGLISGLRPFDGGLLVQTTAAISGGSSGGGLFDAKGRLVGIITFTIKGAQQLNFALPGEWILSLDRRSVRRRPIPDPNDQGLRSGEFWVRGYFAMQAGDLEKAAEMYLQATAVNPSNVEAWLALGDVDKRLKRPESVWAPAFRIAIQLEQDYIRRAPANYRAWLNLGRAYNELEQYENAANAFKAAIPLVPANSPDEIALTWSALAETWVSAGHLDQAIDALEKATRLYPMNADLCAQLANAHYELGSVLSRKGDADGEIAEYREAVQINPGNAFLWLPLARALRERGDRDGSIVAYREAIRLDPSFVSFRVLVGDLFLEKGDLESAIIECREVARVDSTASAAHNCLGLALMKKGDLDGAVAEFTKAIAYKPDQAEAYLNLGLVLEKKGNTHEALVQLRKAYQLDPKNSEIRGDYERLLRGVNQ